MNFETITSLIEAVEPEAELYQDGQVWYMTVNGRVFRLGETEEEIEVAVQRYSDTMGETTTYSVGTEIVYADPFGQHQATITGVEIHPILGTFYQIKTEDGYSCIKAERVMGIAEKIDYAVGSWITFRDTLGVRGEGKIVAIEQRPVLGTVYQVEEYTANHIHTHMIKQGMIITAKKAPQSFGVVVMGNTTLTEVFCHREFGMFYWTAKTTVQIFDHTLSVRLKAWTITDNLPRQDEWEIAQ